MSQLETSTGEPTYPLLGYDKVFVWKLDSDELTSFRKKVVGFKLKCQTIFKGPYDSEFIHLSIR